MKRRGGWDGIARVNADRSKSVSTLHCREALDGPHPQMLRGAPHVDAATAWAERCGRTAAATGVL